MSGKLEGKVALITGGTSGLGLETARLFLEEGAAVVVTGRDPDRGTATEDELGSLGPALFVRADAASPADTAMVVRRTEERFGRLDILIANAGIGVVAPLSETTQADWQAILATNVGGCLYAAQGAMAAMRRANHGGALVLIGSDAGVVGERAIGAYSVSKAAVIMMAKVLAMDGAPHGIRVNCLCPGYIAPGMRHFPDRTAHGSDAPGDVDPPIPPLGRYGCPRDVAQGALYLVSDESSFCTGTVLMLEGGITAGIP